MGYNTILFSEPWKELEEIVQRYIRYDERYDVVMGNHLKLLAYLRQKVTLNIPLLLKFMLHETTFRVRKAKDPLVIISHHGLIKLLVERRLQLTQ